jgi:transposase
MTNITILGIDLAKNVFELCGLNATGEVVYTRTVKRQDFIRVVCRLDVKTVAMEACGSAHHWYREFTALGMEVKLLHPHCVKPFVKTQKNDRNDACAIAVAASQKTMTFVPPKTLAQQDIQSLLRIRERLVNNRTQLINEMRGLLHEYGISFRTGANHFKKAVVKLLDAGDERLTEMMRRALNRLYTEWLNMAEEIKAHESELTALFNQSEDCQRLYTMPGVGLISALAVVALVGDIKHFRNARHLSAYLGLIPQQNSSGGHQKLLGISKRGNTYVRTLLIHGARAILSCVDKFDDARSRWIKALKDRCGFNKACVAIANKQARIIWALLTRGENYNVNHQPQWGLENAR